MPAYGYEFYLLVVNSISHSFSALTREFHRFLHRGRAQLRGRQPRPPPLQIGIDAKILKISPEWRRILIDEFFLYFSFIPPTVSEKIDAEVTNTAFSIWSVPNSATKGMQAVSNLPISAWLSAVFWLPAGKPWEAKRGLVGLKRPAFLEFLWSLSLAPIILRKLYLWLQRRFSRKLLEGWSWNSAKR